MGRRSGSFRFCFLQIHISRRAGADFVFWPFTKFGDYTVRSAYNLARYEKFQIERSKPGNGVNSAVQDDSFAVETPVGSQSAGQNENTFVAFRPQLPSK